MQSAALQQTLELVPWSGRLDAFDAPAGAAVTAWLQEQGLLTERLRACCPGRSGLTVVAEYEASISTADVAELNASGTAAFVREVRLTCDDRPWVFAQTLIPQTTLARHRWLSALGDSALGERLAAIPDIARGPLEFTRLFAPAALYQRAIRGDPRPPPALWARRSWFALDGDRLMVQEVFLPEALA